MDNPLVIFVISFVATLLAAHTGAYLSEHRAKLSDTEQNVLGVVLTGVLTLYAVIIGFSFSMAAARYDQRKLYEEAEANAIGTEYLRLGLLPPDDVARARTLMRSYLEQRILFYTTRDAAQLRRVDSATLQLQEELWSRVQGPTNAAPTPVAAVVATGMNDVLNSQSYTQAAWWNRLPTAAWALIIAISICCSLLFGFYATHESGRILFLSLPLILAITFFLLADMDSPRHGVIRVHPQNLLSLSTTLYPR
jgi:hypothetical protein